MKSKATDVITYTGNIDIEQLACRIQDLMQAAKANVAKEINSAINRPIGK